MIAVPGAEHADLLACGRPVVRLSATLGTWAAARSSPRSATPAGHRAPRGSLQDSDNHLLAVWAAGCAMHVLHLFEEAQPDDDRPRRAIELTRAWVRGEITMTQARSAFAANAAGRRLAQTGGTRRDGWSASGNARNFPTRSGNWCWMTSGRGTRRAGHYSRADQPKRIRCAHTHR